MPVDRINPRGLHQPTGYSHVVKAGNLVFIAGQVGMDASGRVVAEDCEAQTLQAYRNVEAALASVGATWANVTRVTTYLTRVEDIPAMRRGREQYRLRDMPASTLLVVQALARPELRIEVEATAVLG